MAVDMLSHMRPARTQRGRLLRREMTRGEWKLWSRLRGRRLAGLKFRRQAPVGPFVVDFYCPAQRLVIEVDGPQHANRLLQDGARDGWLRAHGYRVLRFSADHVFRKTDDVVDAVCREIRRGLPLPPSGTTP